mmetsp:Transcript_86442/g.193249  ORF Transcript_86442/g.193249 Transcript_86442/m.193249 type:complete len:471 (-) Transcript_86442:36-1448(-)
MYMGSSAHEAAMVATATAALPSRVRESLLGHDPQPRGNPSKLPAEGLDDAAYVVDGIADHIFSQAVLQAHYRHTQHVLLRDLGAALEGSERSCGAVRYDVPAQPVHVQPRANLGDLDLEIPGHGHFAQSISGIQDLLLHGNILVRELGLKLRGILTPQGRSRQDLRPGAGIIESPHADGEPEAVQELWPQVALVRVRSAHEDEACGMPNAHALPLDGVPTACSAVEKNVHKLVVQQVDLVDVEDAPIHARENSGLESLATLEKRALDVDCPGHAVLRGAQRQLHEGSSPVNHGQLLTSRDAIADLIAHDRNVLRAGIVLVVGDGRDVRQKPNEAPDRFRLPSAAVALNEDASNDGVYQVQEQRQLHFLLADHCRKGEGRPKVPVFFDLRTQVARRQGYCARSSPPRQPRASATAPLWSSRGSHEAERCSGRRAEPAMRQANQWRRGSVARRQCQTHRPAAGRRRRRRRGH